MSEMIAAMGPMIWLIMFFAVLALAVLAERLFYFHRININSADFLRGLSALLRSGQYDECLHEARQLPGPMARVVEAVLSRPRLPRHELREIALEASEVEVYRIERNVRTLLVCATVMPLLGVLGTLLSLVSFYEQPGVTDGAAAAPIVAATLQQSLLLSSAGIALAIPAYLFYMYLASRARKLINQVERAGLECVHIIADAREDALLKQTAEEAMAAVRGCVVTEPAAGEEAEEEK